MKELNQLIANYIKDFGWLISVISAGITISLNFIIRKREAKYDHKYAEEIEEFKYNLSKKENVINASLNAITNNSQLHYEKTVSAIEELWLVMIQMRKFSSQVNLVYGILLPEEYDGFVQSGKFDKSLIQEDAFIKFTNEIDVKVASVRPFVDSELWNKFTLYQAFMLRNVFLFNKGIREGNIQPWYEDGNLVQLCELLIGGSKLKDYKKIGSYITITQTMEETIVLNMRKVLNGNKLSDEIINRRIEINKVVKDSEFYEGVKIK